MSLLSIRQLGIEFTGAHGPQRVLHGWTEVGAGEVVAVWWASRARARA